MAQRTAHRNSNTISGSSSVYGGRGLINERLRSVLFHEVSLSLFLAIYKPEYCPHTSEHEKESRCTDAETCLVTQKKPKTVEHDLQSSPDPSSSKFPNNEELNEFFKQCYDEAVKKNNEILTKGTKSQLETSLTTAIVENSKSIEGLPFKLQKEFDVGRGKIDIIVHEKKGRDDIPLMVMEFGLFDGEWWCKFHQCAQYVELLYETGKCIQPILMSVLTIENQILDKNHYKQMKVGVFFCRPSSSPDNPKDFRMSLLWHSNSKTRDLSSNDFGMVLYITAKFQQLRKKCSAEYEYFSSNCCRYGEEVSSNNSPSYWRHFSV